MAFCSPTMTVFPPYSSSFLHIHIHQNYAQKLSTSKVPLSDHLTVNTRGIILNHIHTRTTPGASAMRSAILGLLVFTLLTSTFAAALPEYDQTHSSIYHSTAHSPSINLISSQSNGLVQEEANINNNHIPTPTTLPTLVPTASDSAVKVAYDSTPIMLRPTAKPRLLTDFEFETMWDLKWTPCAWAYSCPSTPKRLIEWHPSSEMGCRYAQISTLQRSWAIFQNSIRC